jgi:hypothetical protein
MASGLVTVCGLSFFPFTPPRSGARFSSPFSASRAIAMPRDEELPIARACISRGRSGTPCLTYLAGQGDIP